MKTEQPLTCKACGTEHFDPVTKSALSEGEDFCTWCALRHGQPDGFLSIRSIHTAEDKRILAAESSLETWAKAELNNPADFDWYSEFVAGESYAKKWSDYLVQLVGVPHRISEQIGRPHFYGFIPNHRIHYRSVDYAVDDALYVCRARIFYRFSWAYLQFSYNKPIGPQIDMRNIRRADNQQLSAVRRGEGLFSVVQKSKPGPKPGSIQSREICLRRLEEILRTNPRMIQEELALAFGRRTFFRYRDQHHVFSDQDVESLRKKILSEVHHSKG